MPPPQIKLRVRIGGDRTIRLPNDVPEGPADVTVVMQQATGGRRPRRELMGIDAGKFVVPDDIDAPLPADLRAHFEGRAED